MVVTWFILLTFCFRSIFIIINIIIIELFRELTPLGAMLVIFLSSSSVFGTLCWSQSVVMFLVYCCFSLPRRERRRDKDKHGIAVDAA